MPDDDPPDPSFALLKAKAQQLGTNHGTVIAEDFGIRDPEHAKAILQVLDAHHLHFTFHTRVNETDIEKMCSDLGVDGDSPHLADLRIAYQQAASDATTRVLRVRATQVSCIHWPATPFGYHKVRVMLTATSNPYFAQRLPVKGELEVFATTPDLRLIPGQVVFREELRDGTLGMPCEVFDIAVIYETSTDDTDRF